MYSLIASRLGPVATEFTETETSSLQAEMESSASIGAPGVAKGELSSSLQSTRSQGTQVLRKSIVQTTFKELYEYEEDNLAMRPRAQGEPVPRIPNDDLARAAGTVEFAGWIIDPDTLTRGRLAELEIDLSTDPIYQLSAVVSAFLDIVQEDATVFGISASSQLSLSITVNRILERLLAGLIPLRACVVNYEVVELGGKEWIVHRAVLDAVSSAPGSRRPFYLVGVADQALFWKDIRRVLFSESRFRALCRISQSGLRTTWTPVKLLDVFATAIPDLREQLQAVSSTALGAMGTAIEPNDEITVERVKDALANYSARLEAHYGAADCSSEPPPAAPLRVETAEVSTLSGRRRLFASATRAVEQRHGIPVDPLVAVQYRTEALQDAGIGPDGKLVLPETKQPLLPDEATQRLLDSEFVAIYW